MTRDDWTRVEPLAMQALALPEAERPALFAAVTLSESARRELLTALRSIEQFSVVQSGVAAIRVLSHPNIPTLHRVFRARSHDSDIGVLVSEYVDGTPASRALAEGEVHVSQALRWTRQVADAIAHAHDHHLLHGRLHSGNVIITPQDDAKVVDLDIGAVALDGLASATPSTPPEQFTARNYSEQGDIYALGVLLVELVTRRLPFAGEGGVLWLRAMVEPAPLLRRFDSEVAPALQDVIDCALDKNPLRRFPSARAFKAPLDVVAEQSVTRLLEAWSAGREEALEQLLPVVYNELRRIARVQLARDRRGHTLQATDLVHEAFVRLVDQRASWRNRVHFFAIAATCMRRVLVDRARRRGAQKRPQIDPSVEIQGLERGGDTGIDWIIAVDETLHEIEKTDARQARVAELKVFTDLENEEIADVLGVSVATVKRDWAEARSILRRNLGKVPR